MSHSKIIESFLVYKFSRRLTNLTSLKLKYHHYIRMANKWVEFIKSWAKKHNKSYGCALSDPQLKIDYRKAHPSKQQQKERETSERETMGMEDRDALEEEVLIVEPTKKKRKSTKKLEAKERETMAMEDEFSYQTRERPKIGIFKEPKMLQYAIASKKSKLFNRELMKKLDEEMKKIDEEKKQIKEEMKKLEETEKERKKERKELEMMEMEDRNVTPKGKQRLKPEDVAEFAKRLPTDLARYAASFLLVKDPLELVDRFDSLVILREIMMRLGEYKIGSGVYFVKEFTSSDTWSEKWVDGKKYKMRAKKIIDDVNNMKNAIKEIVKTDNFSIDVYYGGGFARKKALKFNVYWVGKKGTKGQQQLWDSLYKEKILPVVNDVQRWLRAEKVLEDNFKSSQALEEKKMETAKKNIGLNTTKTSAELVSLIGRLSKKHNIKYGGYTKFKNNTPEEILVSVLRQVEGIKTPGVVNFINDFKSEV